jgi:hypothetical protein
MVRARFGKGCEGKQSGFFPPMLEPRCSSCERAYFRLEGVGSYTSRGTRFPLRQFCFCVLYSVICTLFSILCILYSVFCILYSVLCILYSVVCIVDSVYYVLCILYSLFFYRDRLEALAGLIRPSRRKLKCDRTATRRHLLPLGVTGRVRV